MDLTGALLAVAFVQSVAVLILAVKVRRLEKEAGRG